jgi:type IV secretion system protein VirB4
MNPILELVAKVIAKRKNKDPKTLSAKMPDEDFIPYVCHYDSDTILTKNGELLQIIRITGFNNASAVSELISLRETVRDSLLENIKESNLAFWFTTLRRKKNIAPEGDFAEFLASETNAVWEDENDLDDQYVNELYITVIIEGIDTSIINFKSFFRSFSYSSIKSLHNGFLKKAHKKLTALTNKVLEDVESYGGKIIGINEWGGVLYSEPMRFFGKIVNLYEARYPLACNDISNEISSHKTAFGDRELQVVGNKNKNFAAIFSLKEYFEVSTASLDKVLQLPLEFIITQSFDFSYSRKDLESFEYQNYILQVSGDEEFRQTSGIANFIENRTAPATDYGKEQVTIMLISKTHEGLESDIKMAFEQFNALGFSVVREDVFLEHCFWAQLPANFHFLKRQKIINTNRVAGFAALHNFPSGTIAGNHWGPAVCVMQTVLDTPYFFNFHDGMAGHTAIIGDEYSDRAGLINFLLLQARKFNNKIFYLDLDNSGECLIKGLGGDYYNTTNKDPDHEEFLHLNPLLPSKGKDNEDFLIRFFTSLVAFSKDPISKVELDLIPRIVKHIIAAKVANFAGACESFNLPETSNIYDKLKIWNGKALQHIFGSKKEIDWSSPIIGFDLTEFINKKPIVVPMVSYLLHHIEKKLDGGPAIIVINEAWNLFDSNILAPQVSGLLERLKRKNTVAILTTKHPEKILNDAVSAKIKEKISTQIFMPNEEPPESYEKVFGLNDDEIEIIKVMENEEGHFLLKHAEDSLIIALNLLKLGKIFKMLSPNQDTLAAMRAAIADNLDENQKPVQPEVWVKQLLNVLQKIDDEAIAAEKERIRQEAIAQRKALGG